MYRFDNESLGLYEVNAGGIGLGVLPVLFALAYAFMKFHEYGTMLDWNLQYRGPPLPQLPEDVLGYGFLTLWLPFFVLWIFVQTGVTWYSPRWLVASSIALFCVTSLLDYGVFSVLEGHVMGALKYGAA